MMRKFKSLGFITNFRLPQLAVETQQRGILVMEQPVLVKQLPISFNHREFSKSATSISSDIISTSVLEVTVNRISVAEVDNMECACAPTGKDTVIDLVTIPGLQSLEGFVKVEHDGSSESCSLRNPLQECHVRVILQRLDQGQVVGEEVLFDDTFRTNEKVIDFEISNDAYSQGETMQLRLETDQLRDWHKPTAEWNLSAS